MPGMPRTHASARNCWSLPTAMTRSRSAAGNTAYGAMLGCWLPRRRGARPVASVEAAWFVSAESRLWRRFTSTRRPRPVRSRSRRASRIPTTAFCPQSTSTRATPALDGSPSGSPVIDMRPPTACTSRSYPASVASRAEPGDRAVDEAGIHRTQVGVGQPEPRHHAGPEVLDHDVGGCREPARLGEARVGREVECDRALVAVDAAEVRGLVRPHRRAASSGGCRRPWAARP